MGKPRPERLCAVHERVDIGLCDAANAARHPPTDCAAQRFSDTTRSIGFQRTGFAAPSPTTVVHSRTRQRVTRPEST